jgi:hypothetical protein
MDAVETAATDAPEATATSAPASKGPPHRRILASKILLVLFCVSMVLSVVAIWARNQINDTDRYVRTVGPLASDPDIQLALSDRASTQISALLDEIVAREGLIDRDGFLVAPLVGLLEDYVDQTVRTFIASDQFPVIWEQMNRLAHPAVSEVLTGGGTATVYTEHGQITLDLAPLLTEIINRLSERGIDIVNRIQVDQLDTTFVIFESQGLADAQFYVSVLEGLAFWLPVVALISLGASLVLSVDRRQTIVWGGLGLAAAMAISLMLLAFVRWWTVNHLPPATNRDAATAFFETTGRYLRDAIRVLTLIGLVVAAIAFFVRPGVWVSRERKAAWQSVKSAWHSARARWPGLEKVGAWSNDHRLALAIGLGVICCLLVVALDPLSINWATTILLVAVVGFAVLWLRHARAGAAATAAPGLTPAFAGDGVAMASRVQVTGATRDGAMTGSTSSADDARADLVALAGELPVDDVRILRRLAFALRDSG